MTDLADDVARDPDVRRGVRIFGTLIGIQMIIGIIMFVVVLVVFVIVATKILSSSNDPGFGGLGTVQIVNR